MVTLPDSAYACRVALANRPDLMDNQREALCRLAANYGADPDGVLLQCGPALVWEHYFRSHGGTDHNFCVLADHWRRLPRE